MKPTLLIFSAEPGGAEILSPVVRILQDTGEFNVHVVAYGHGLKRFIANGVKCVKIDKIGRNDTSILNGFKINLIITSATGHPKIDMSEKYLWESARTFHIRTIAFLDQWQNYTTRFSGPTEAERLAYLPDLINCIDNFAREEMKEEGFPNDILVPLGHPYLSGLPAAIKGINVAQLKKRIGLNSDKAVELFVSEPIHEYYGRDRGYDQYDVLNFFFQSIASEEDAGQRAVIVKLHPKDDPDKFEALQKKYGVADVRFIQNELSPLECITLADRIYGMTSIMLIEAYILGKEVLSLQPDLKTIDPLILSRRGLIDTITTYDATNFASRVRKQNSVCEFPVQFLQDDFLALVRHELSAMGRVNHQ